MEELRQDAYGDVKNVLYQSHSAGTEFPVLVN